MSLFILFSVSSSIPLTTRSVTSVGATSGTHETGASFSSGGFSAIFERPPYQEAAVANYLEALGNTNSGKFVSTGRAFPDVSAQGVNLEIVVGAEFGLVDGTSCSSPIFASVISLLNDQLIAANKSPLGFLNPFLYSTGASALNDITTGSNPGCNTDGFPARAGWDPVSTLLSVIRSVLTEHCLCLCRLLVSVLPTLLRLKLRSVSRRVMGQELTHIYMREMKSAL